ncbi:nicotinamide riboside transporter PnuC [Aureibaculum marinum]|uniref:Nicotinamide riboside transporter PnuC n=1 Tax=Aureibaculum marinum TaxID=2487930 RepID=A0A3N4NQ96_9FLAO|nr:nicotinamide riboside transporter PnuC [Aureibaculum marinum]RPD96678.1 nicotinamide riboside transporter PnuC [Aureibaculum marinum]
MNEIIDFFIAPYREASTLDIFLEFTAMLFGVVGVWFGKKEHILVYPLGIISTGIYIYICYKFVLYGDFIINIYYTIMSIFGWYMWSKVIDDKKNHIPISRTTTSDNLKALGIFLFTSLFVIVVYRYYNVMPNHLNFSESVSYAIKNMTSGSLEDFRKITPFLDTFTTGIFFAAMWLMALKKIEHWILWIFGNIVAIPLYFVKGLGFTGIQFIVLLVIAYLGYKEWKKSLDKPKMQTL